MTINKYTPFAESGSKPSAAVLESEAAAGMVDEQLRYTRFNGYLNRADVAINDIARDGVRTLSDADTETALIKNFHAAPFGKSRDAANVFDISSDSVYDMQYCNHATRGRILVLPVYLSIKAFDIEAGTDLGDIVTQAQLVAGFTSITIPNPISICCDAEYVYVLCRQSATATPQVQAFSIADGTVHPDWPAGGVAMSTYAAAYSNYWEARIRWVAADKLGVSQPWVTVTAGTHHAVKVLDSADGTVLGNGAGDFAGTSGRCVGICGNGGNAFFVIQETGQANICSMDLAAYGNTGCGGTLWPFLDVSWDNNEFGGILCAGHTVVVTSAGYNNTYILRILDDENGDLASLASTDAWILEGLGQLAFTGLSWWVLGRTADSNHTVYKLKAVDEYGVVCPNPHTPLIDAVDRYAVERPTSFNVNSCRISPLVFDGRDLWFLTGTSTLSYYNLRRLPRVNTR